MAKKKAAKKTTKKAVKKSSDSEVIIKVKKLHPDAIVPKYAHEGDAGMDLYSLDNLILKPNYRAKIRTGISAELPKGYVALFWDKSGMGSKGIKVLGGVVDATYRGEYTVMLVNLSSQNLEIKKGQKIAQLLIQKVESAKVEVVDELSETSRGVGGFGSTGNY